MRNKQYRNYIGYIVRIPPSPRKMSLYYRLFFPNQAFRQLEDIERELTPFMHLTAREPIVKEPAADPPPPNPEPNPIVEIPIEQSAVELPPQPPSSHAPDPIYPKQPDSLFWCIYIARHGYKAYTEIGHRYGNTEIEEKQRMVELMRAAPNKIKDCTKRITKAQFQEIMSDFMTNKRVTPGMLTAFAIYCDLRIWIMNLASAWYMDICSHETMDADPILIYCKHGHRNQQYGIDLVDSEQQQATIQKYKQELFRFDNYNAPLRPISNYKNADLETIADQLGIELEGKYKKQDVYDKILQKLSVV